MPPPGWRVPGTTVNVSPDGVPVYSPQRPAAPRLQTNPGTQGDPRLATPQMNVVGGNLWPGLHLIAGPHGVGKTQLLLQTAVQNALLGIKTQVDLPHTAPREASLRVASTMANIPWSGLAEQHHDEIARWLDRLQGAPLSLNALHRPEAEPSEILSRGTILYAFDHSRGPDRLDELRHQALQSDAIILWVCASQQPQTPPDIRAPLACARACGVSDELLGLCDSAWVLMPVRPPTLHTPGEVNVALAKSRCRPSGSLRSTFNGALFEDHTGSHDLGYATSI